VFKNSPPTTEITTPILKYCTREVKYTADDDINDDLGLQYTNPVDKHCARDHRDADSVVKYINRGGKYDSLS